VGGLVPPFLFLLRKEGIKLLVRAIHCEECNTTVYSRTSEDLRECKCGRVRVYGGFTGHFKYDIMGKKTKFKPIKMEIKATPDDLYDDYENMEDRFGLINKNTDKEKTQTTYVF
tara:strand:+ start:395 stop:736 length:342 start_codon:yes stop_codon:yes gene_type:complete